MATKPPGTGTPAGRNVQLGAGLPPAAGGKQTVAGSPAPKVGSDPGSPCLISSPSLPLVGSVGGGCLLSKTNVRAMVGGLLVGAGGILFIGGVVVLAAAGFRKTGAVDKVAAGVGFVPGVGPVAAAGIRSAARPEQRHARRAAEDARLERRLGQPRENRNLRTGKGAVRETPTGTRRRRATRSDDEPPF
jgi:hypothetical protein